MKKIFKKEIAIGISAVIALVILYSGIEFLKGINIFKPTNHYYVSYTNVAGLGIASPVTVNGFKVGQVLNIQYEYDNPGHVLVEISLDKELKLPKGTKAVLASDLLGSASIMLDMGTDKSFYEIGEKIDGEIPSGLMDNITNNIMPSLSEIMPKIDSILTSVNLIVGDPAIAASVKRFNDITANLSETTEKLNQFASKLNPAMVNITEFTTDLNEISSDLAIVSEELKSIHFDSTMRSINTTAKNLQSITSSLNSPNSSLGLLLNDTKLYNNLNGAAGSLDSLLIDVKKNPKRYISIKLL